MSFETCQPHHSSSCELLLRLLIQATSTMSVLRDLVHQLRDFGAPRVHVHEAREGEKRTPLRRGDRTVHAPVDVQLRRSHLQCDRGGGRESAGRGG
jgi:hypothetical protein